MMEEVVSNILLNPLSESSEEALKGEVSESLTSEGILLSKTETQLNEVHLSENTVDGGGDQNISEGLINQENSCSRQTCQLLNGFSYLQPEYQIFNSFPLFPHWTSLSPNVHQNDQSLLYGYNWYNGWMNLAYGIAPQSSQYIVKTNNNLSNDVPLLPFSFSSQNFYLESNYQPLEEAHNRQERSMDGMMSDNAVSESVVLLEKTEDNSLDKSEHKEKTSLLSPVPTRNFENSFSHCNSFVPPEEKSASNVDKREPHYSQNMTSKDCDEPSNPPLNSMSDTPYVHRSNHRDLTRCYVPLTRIDQFVLKTQRLRNQMFGFNSEKCEAFMFKPLECMREEINGLKGYNNDLSSVPLDCSNDPQVKEPLAIKPSVSCYTYHENSVAFNASPNLCSLGSSVNNTYVEESIPEEKATRSCEIPLKASRSSDFNFPFEEKCLPTSSSYMVSDENSKVSVCIEDFKKKWCIEEKLEKPSCSVEGGKSSVVANESCGEKRSVERLQFKKSAETGDRSLHNAANQNYLSLSDNRSKSSKYSKCKSGDVCNEVQSNENPVKYLDKKTQLSRKVDNVLSDRSNELVVNSKKISAAAKQNKGKCIPTSCLSSSSVVKCEEKRINNSDKLFSSVGRQKHHSSSKRSLSKKQESERTKCHMSYLLKCLPELAKNFDLHRKVGEGTFSSVFLGTLRPEVASHIPELQSKKFAIKHLIPTILPKRIARELKFLHQIGGKDNVIGVNLSIRNGDCCVIVMPYLSHRRFSEYVLDMDVEETRDYIRNLMIALKRVHSFNVIHRDVKPSNFLYNRESRRYLLVDFGLSQSVCPQAKWTVNAKKRKRPEDGSSEPKCENEVLSGNKLKEKRGILQMRNKEDANIPKQNYMSQSVKRPRLTDSSSRSQKMIEQLKQGSSLGDNKRAPLTPKVVNRQNVPRTQTFKLPYSSPKVLQKEISIRKKLFSSNNENEFPKSCGTSAKFDTSLMNSSPSVSRKQPLQLPMPPSKSHVSTIINMQESTGPFSSNDSPKQKFQTLVPKPVNDGCSVGSTLVRVQNSQVKAQVLKPMSPFQSEIQRKLLFKKQGLKRNPDKDRKCFCKELAQVCSTCLKQPSIPAPRAGTPGFRPPEVLLKYPMQTTAVDMWAAGVIMLCILTGCYPFFRSPDDITALAEIMTVFGTENIQSVAKGLGRTVLCGNSKPPLDLRKLCERLRRRRKDFVAGLPDTTDTLPMCPKCENTIDEGYGGCLCLNANADAESVLTGEFPSSAYDLLKKLLDLDPVTRITAEQALEHPFLKGE